MKNADEPAMPFEGGQNNGYQPSIGLTKREHFAAMAMQALIPIYWERKTLDEYETAEELVKCLMESSVEHADALLKELDK